MYTMIILVYSMYMSHALSCKYNGITHTVTMILSNKYKVLIANCVAKFVIL